MSERSTLLLLLDINEAINKIFLYTKDYSLSEYEADSKTKEAVERNFEIIGEAAARVSEDFKQRHNTVEWRILKDFRNVIIHDYFGINNQIVWDTIQLRLAELREKIQKLIHIEQDNSSS